MQIDEDYGEAETYEVGTEGDGSVVAGAAGFDQRRIEPAAKLIASFDVNVRRPTQVVAILEHRDRRRTAVKPDVEDVGLFRKLRGAALLAFEIRGQQFSRIALVPGIR